MNLTWDCIHRRLDPDVIDFIRIFLEIFAIRDKSRRQRRQDVVNPPASEPGFSFLKLFRGNTAALSGIFHGVRSKGTSAMCRACTPYSFTRAVAHGRGS